MAYNAVASATSPGSYDIFNNGVKLATGTAAILGNYGLSTSNLGAVSQTPASTPVPASGAAGQSVVNGQPSNIVPGAPITNGQPTLPNAPDSIYQQYSTQVAQGLLSPAAAQQQLSSLFGTTYSGSLDISKLFPSGQTFTLANGQTVQFDNSNTGTTIKTSPLQNGSVVTASGETVNPPPQSSFGSTLTAPTGTTPPTLPTATGTAAVAAYTASIASTLDAQNAQLTTAYQAQQANYQQQIDAANAAAQTAQQMAEAGLASENSTIADESAAKTVALQQEQQQFTDSYNANQQIIAQMTTLSQTGQQIIDQLQGTTGLSSIMSPRISQTMADVTGQMGLLQAVLSANNSQIGAAQNQLKSATDAITSLYSDQISYYQNVISYYTDQQKTSEAQVASLTKDQQTYIDAQITQLQTQQQNTQTMADTISKALLDPSTALLYAQAGVSLTDTPAQANAKLAVVAQQQAVITSNDAMTKAGYSTMPIPGQTNESIIDQYGKTWYRVAGTPTQQAGGGSAGSTAPSSSEVVSQFTSAINSNFRLSDGTPLLDNHGYITPGAWAAFVATNSPAAVTAVIKQFASKFYAPGGEISSTYQFNTTQTNAFTNSLPS